VKKLRTEKEAKRLDCSTWSNSCGVRGFESVWHAHSWPPQADVEGRTVEISATVTDLGIEERPKTKAGWLVIAVPPHG
jgi:hypothetical protein